MITKLYCVYDSKSTSYGHPFHAPNDAVALRIFGEAVCDPATQLNKYPEDFVLYCIGDYNDETAEIKNNQLRSVTTALAMKVMTNGTN